jgi:hypothetical protein
LVVVGINPATHRQPDDASAAVQDGKRERQGAGNNPAPVNPDEKLRGVASRRQKPVDKQLLFFGKDFLVLNLGITGENQSQSLQFLNSIFSFPHNDTNAAEILELEWANSGTNVSIHFAFTKEGDELALVFQGKEKILSIHKVTEQSQLRTRMRYKYMYRISFYGVFFALHRIDKLEITSYWKMFLEDIETSHVAYSISRLDLCADITNVKPIEIATGIRGVESHMKDFSTFKGKLKKGNPETIMYGSKGDNNWFGRIYNKLVEMAGKGKERLYLDYLLHGTVTRLELVFKSSVLTGQYNLTLAQCLDEQLLFNLFCNHLKTKYVSWDILPFLRREMRKRGIERMTLERYKKLHNPLPRDQKFKRIKNAVRRYREDYDYDLRFLCDHIYLSIEEDDD